MCLMNIKGSKCKTMQWDNIARREKEHFCAFQFNYVFMSVFISDPTTSNAEWAMKWNLISKSIIVIKLHHSTLFTPHHNLLMIKEEKGGKNMMMMIHNSCRRQIKVKLKTYREKREMENWNSLNLNANDEWIRWGGAVRI